MDWKQKKAVEKKVYEKFPVSKGEMKCRNEKRDMDRLRANYRKKLYEEIRSEKAEY